MKTVYFISDAHLGLGDPEEEFKKNSALLGFLEHVRSVDGTLFIMGDLFDFWFEYKSVIPGRHFGILAALANLKAAGVTIHYLTGNHDFWLDSFFQKELDVLVHTDPVDMRLDGKRFWIAHGDGIMKKDHGYRLLKRILRHPLSIFLYRLLHPDLAFGIAGFFSRLSRDNPTFPDEDSDYVSEAKARFAAGFDCVVMSHTHRPMSWAEGGRLYVNTGDWMRHFSYAKFENGQLSLERWPVEQTHHPESELNSVRLPAVNTRQGR
jgi:UDP-2,3-diacylglucosamine hydrolase